MSIRVAISHKTHYKFDRLVNLSPHVIRLRPAPHSRTPIEGYTLNILPKEHFINWQQDPFGNYLARIVFPEKAKELSVEVEVIANMTVINPFDFFVEEYAEEFPFQYDTQLQKELVPYLELKENGPLLKEWLKKIDVTKKLRIVDFLVKINSTLANDINYTIRMEPGVQTCEQTLGRVLGSCRDTAWLLVMILRHLGLAARFVSGYLVQLTADIKSLDGPSGPEQDFTDLHAWAEVYIPGAGWIGLDATSGLFAGEGHIPLACTPDPSSAAAISGFTDKCESIMDFSNTVSRIHEDPRVTKPYTEDQWSQIESLGYQVDADLEAMDVRLTMGGEPTFVSIDDMESAQWNTAADGKHKRQLAGDLIKRLRDSFGPGGLIHFGQGKWYPGEPLPRWQLGLFWRKDGYPIWKNIDLIADDSKTYNYTFEDAERFGKELAKHLAINPSNLTPAYEDAFYFVWEEGKVPVNIDPLKYNLKDPIERQALADLLKQGMNNPVGFVLPMEWNYWNNQWLSCAWEFRRKHLFLVPGNSPIGLRLPLESLPVTAKSKRNKEVERSPFEELPQMDNFHESIEKRYGLEFADERPSTKEIIAEEKEEKDKRAKDKKERKEPDEEKEIEPEFEVNTVRTALCVEARKGVIYIFLPPLHYMEHYLDMVASIEATAAKLKVTVRIEGYEPPRDHRVQRLVVSPDPGVIEVNIHPAKTWKDLVHNISTLYDQAHLSRLGTEKFMLDGKHSGSGGGNHVTIGGETASDSPILRRPDLLRSFITYWQHHPGLSYLFSGSFIGPTSQAPRLDEGRDERLYEAEIAFEQVPDDGFVPFYLVDRIFRNLLTDLTGNTHRTEFCIDKLYSSDSSSGRLGILEFRAFEMPPHKQMSLVQMLLIRSLLAWFWKNPYKHKLVRWGTELHDRFMISHYVKQDLSEVVEDLNRTGYRFELDWFNPFFEFRFPHYGSVKVKHMELELRSGIEPWHVLGEEVSSSGTARFVDSSVERLELIATGFTDSRYIVLCNGCRVPMKPTGVRGEYVAGIRYRAWSPPSALHPTIGVDTPLVIDVVDTWNGRSVGGCTYFVSHPGGRAYDTIPVNSYEAESRRVSRFWSYGHTPDEMTPSEQFVPGAATRYIVENIRPVVYDAPREVPNPDYPYTLDLRKFWSPLHK
jgi:uncharacterized protein (DUF2126 family)/transglutaminase-like putative cysteine protease